MRIRIRFKKNEAMRFTGHLDLHHTWMRVFRRAEVQLEYSQGFHPQPKLQLASALPLGYISSAEVLDCWIREAKPVLDLARSVQAALPPGLEVMSLEEIPLDAPKIQVVLRSADYIVHLPEDQKCDSLPEKLQEFLSRSEIIVERKGKPRNIRDLVDSLEFNGSLGGRSTISMRLSARESATGRADEVITILGIDPLRCLIERTGLNFD